MKVKKLELKNFRGIHEMTLDFSDHVNVLVGMNGAGKTSILDAVAIMLSHLTAKICSANGRGRQFVDNDIRNNESETTNKISVTYDNENTEWEVTKTRKGRKQQSITNLSEIKNIVEKVHQKIEKNVQESVPPIVFYSVDRAVVDVPLRIKNHTFDQVSAYDQALAGKRNNFRCFFEWFRDREDLENEETRRAGIPYIDFQLRAVRDALEKLMPDFDNWQVRRSPLRMIVEKDGKEFRIEQLSDGEKHLLAIVGDLARRLAVANPLMFWPLEGSGIVLIDEIDLHLHPEWQQMVIPQLHEAFPNCQFIVSTHSPQVINHVKPGNIFLLEQTEEGLECSKHDEYYGKDVDIILEDIMGLDSTIPQEINEKLQDLFEKIERNELDEANKLLEELHDKLGADSRLDRANILIKYKKANNE